MDRAEPVVLSWSGGKDSAMALDALQHDERYRVVALLTCVAEEYGRVSHHGVREALLRLQADAIGISLDIVYLPSAASHPCTDSVYEDIMRRAMLRYCEQGVFTVAFGDLFLADLRQYRERNLAQVGMRGLFPLWHRDTTALARSCIMQGFRAYLSCVEGKLGRAFAGRALDARLLDDLPEGVDPCGEYGEYHSFVYDGPIFGRPVDVRLGEIVERDTRFYADLLPAGDPVSVTATAEEIPPV